MRTRQRGELPNDLEQGRRQFQAWRQRRQGRRIPQPLWDLAVRLVSQHGLSRTVTALGLDYYSLKKHVEAAGQQPPSPGPAFVEIPPPLVVSKQALFELDTGAGATMRVQLSGYEVADLEVLARCFGNAR
jgi:signal recognition particle subunit SEC65